MRMEVPVFIRCFGDYVVHHFQIDAQNYIICGNTNAEAGAHAYSLLFLAPTIPPSVKINLESIFPQVSRGAFAWDRFCASKAIRTMYPDLAHWFHETKHASTKRNKVISKFYATWRKAQLDGVPAVEALPEDLLATLDAKLFPTLPHMDRLRFRDLLSRSPDLKVS